MAANTAVYGGLNSGQGPSPGLWRDCPIADLREQKNPNQFGRFVHIDFSRFKLSTNINASVAYWDQGCNGFGDNGFAVAALAALGGGVTLGSDGDNEGGSFQLTSAPFKISRSNRPLWFEARIKTSTIADTKHGFVVGLWEIVTQSATVPIAAAGTLSDNNFVGWHRLEGDGDQLDFKYKADGITEVTLNADAVSGGIVADAFFKVGFKWDPQDKDGPNLLSAWYNGVKLASPYTMASANGTDFPNDVQLAPTFAMLNATGTTPGTTTITDIWCAQLM